MYINNKKLLIVGDLNARIANAYPRHGLQYIMNPDKTMNQNGQKLVECMESFPRLLLVNGLKLKDHTFDSKFTFYRGNTASQNDVCLVNDHSIISEFSILEKLCQSDHCPVAIKISSKIHFPLNLIQECVRGFNCYDHYDVSKKIRPKIRLNRCEPTQLHNELDILGQSLNSKYDEKGLNE